MFETPIKINGQNYIVSFCVELFPNTNNDRTHRVINEIDLVLASHAGTGTDQPQGATKQDLSDATVSQSTDAVNQNNLTKLFQELLYENRTVAQKLLDTVRDFISKVKDKFVYSYEAAQDTASKIHYGVDMVTLEETAMTATRQQVERKENTAQTDGGERYSFERYDPKTQKICPLD